MYFKYIRIVGLLVVLVLFIQCIKEDLSKCERGRLRFELRAIWSEGSQKPAGIRAVIYPVDKNSNIVSNLSPDGGTIRINPGTYAFLIHNNDKEKISFRNIKKYDTYEAYTQDLRVGVYVPAGPPEPIVEQPDRLWATCVARHDIFVSHTLDVYPQQIVKKYIFKLLNVVGTQNIKGARIFVTGMMGTYFLNPNVLPTTSYTLCSDLPTITNNGIGFEILGFGVIEALLQNDNMIPLAHTLTIEFSNGSKIIRYDIDITQLLNAIKNGGEIDIYLHMEIPPGTGGGGFGAGVGDWNNVVVPLN